MTTDAWEPTPAEIDAYSHGATRESFRTDLPPGGDRYTAITRAGLTAAYAALRDRLLAPGPVTLVPDPPTIVTLTPPLTEYEIARSVDRLRVLAAEGWRLHTAALDSQGIHWFVMERERPDQPQADAQVVPDTTPGHATCHLCATPVDVPIGLLVEHMETVHGVPRTELGSAPVTDRTDG